MLRITGLHHRYGRNPRPALDHFSLKLGQGLHGLLGPNGAGKTSLLQILSGVMAGQEGSVDLDGLSPARDPLGWRMLVGYMPQHFDFPPNATAIELMHEAALLMGMRWKVAKPRADELLLAVNLADVAKREAVRFSRGMKQRLMIALTALHDPQLVLLDEPTAGLDPVERDVFRRFLKELSRDRIVVLSTHLVGDVERLCDGVAVIAGGRLLYHGTPERMAGLARSMVWDEVLTAAETDRLVAEGSVVSTRTEAASPGRARVRWVAEKGSPGAEPGEPGIEDAYLALIRGMVAPEIPA